jgi:hypothetical protein
MSLEHTHHDWKKYIIVFLITLGIFLVAIYFSNTVSNRKIATVRSLQDSVTTDILSSETRFALLEQTSCDHLIDGDDPILSEELGLFGSRVASMERERGARDPEVQQVKRYYSLLQIKDYLLTKQLGSKCETDTTTILFFYKDQCAECEGQGYVLNAIQKLYSELRVYSFDINIQLSAVRTLASIHALQEGDMPVLIINDTVYEGFFTSSELETLLQDEGYVETPVEKEEDSVDDDTVENEEVVEQ